VLRFRDFQARRLGELGVEIHTGAEVTAQAVADEAPDVVVVATGAEPLIPPIPGIGAAHVHDAQRFLRGELDATGCKVAIVGGSATGCEAAELLADNGVSVTILEMRSSVGHGIEAITRRHLLRGLKKAGVQILTKAKVVAFEPDHVLYEDSQGSTHAVDSDLVGLAIGWKPRGSLLADGLQGVEVHVLGDAARPSDFVSAINAGADAGLRL
jgi:pyruvate/2-oxoglutarate dehydrogenase complex dihydrolipoamide dehydrogenase (E3) component